ncbi:helix-turn-helix domain-containing protein [Neobacillus sp. BF23-41]|uniref:helix-turn-helix domain-containing protein n=1 Tax=Neobacillus sp. BF23-41 TaxID=3240280 RepID=UPI0034E475D6
MPYLNRDHLEYICRHMNETLKIPFYLFDSNGELLFESSSGYRQNPLYHAKLDYLRQLMRNDDSSEYPIIKSTKLLENYLIVNLQGGDTFQGSIIGGPSVFTNYSEDMIRRMNHDLGFFIDQEFIILYYQSLPIMKLHDLTRAGILVHYMIYHQLLDTENVIKQNQIIEDQEVLTESPDLEISLRRQNTKFHHDYLIEKKLFGAITKGKKEELLNYLNIANEEFEYGVLSKNSQLRSEKNLTISGITLATRAAMEGGLYPEIAYSLSDLYIQRLEELQDIHEVKKLMEKAFGDFAERVHTSQIEQYSKPISLCQNFIFNHVYENITLSQLSELVQLTPNYLSSLFKKETGVSLSEYIQKVKIDEAKNLLTLTSYSLSEICTLLNFTDQSYFIKVFKKFTGVTPKHFKDNPIN